MLLQLSTSKNMRDIVNMLNLPNCGKRTSANTKKEKSTEKVPYPGTEARAGPQAPMCVVASTCGPFWESVVDVRDDSVSCESCKSLQVQPFKSAAFLTDLPSESRESVKTGKQEHPKNPMTHDLHVYWIVHMKLKLKYQCDMRLEFDENKNSWHKRTFATYCKFSFLKDLLWKFVHYKMQ